MRPETHHDVRVTALAALVAVAGVLLHSGLGPPDTFWTIDNGGKALALANLREDPGRTWIDYPGRRLDPELRWFPQPLDGPEPYATVDGRGRVRSQYLSPFVWLALPFAGLGFTGLAVWPSLGAGAAVLLTARLAARRSAAGGGLRAAMILALASPLLFYASVFWEHTVVVALAAAAFVLLSGDRIRPLGAGLLAGAAGLFREECFLLVPALGVVLLPDPDRRGRALPRFAAGAAIAAAAALAVQKATTGSWTGVHLAVNAPVPFVHALDAARGLLLAPGAAGLSSMTTLAALAALAVARGMRQAPAADPLRAAAVAGLGAVSLAACIRFPAGQDEALALIGSNSAAVFLPWALAAPLLPRRAGRAAAGGRPVLAPHTVPRRDPLPLAIGIFVVLFVLLVPERSITGVHPAPRMLLPLLPAAAVLLAERFPTRRVPAAAMLFALTVSAAWGGRSLVLLHDKRGAAGRLSAAIAADPRRVVATDLFWLPTELSPLWDRKELHLVRGPEDLAALGRAAAAAGERQILLVTAPERVAGTPLRSIRPTQLPEFGAELHVVPLAGAGGEHGAPDEHDTPETGAR